jgi:hypothetical protein
VACSLLVSPPIVKVSVADVTATVFSKASANAARSVVDAAVAGALVAAASLDPDEQPAAHRHRSTAPAHAMD